MDTVLDTMFVVSNAAEYISPSLYNWLHYIFLCFQHVFAPQKCDIHTCPKCIDDRGGCHWGT